MCNRSRNVRNLSELCRILVTMRRYPCRTGKVACAHSIRKACGRLSFVFAKVQRVLLLH